MQGIVTLVEEFPRHVRTLLPTRLSEFIHPLTCSLLFTTRQNAPDIDMADQVQRLRAKFRAAASMLGVSVAFALHKTRGGGEPEGLSF